MFEVLGYRGENWTIDIDRVESGPLPALMDPASGQG